ncbi:isopentenyl-diphosphate Delta-isomerase [Pedobacter sp.]|jgi:isopentenyl-diphosphate delta-isomerase|uniref:isopentenyl-diphosphate Delta-isomerase n=1 Tax=Pedobacter sp. TaxID=1411316 RepID=UPI002BB8EF7B|nr:isopentenyl-diphosphate Delta-isomerase [Pedobacter sp.]HWW38645.1 isopentenyl-diphosphate Delta-isomerase [Pedobacter sp.]
MLEEVILVDQNDQQTGTMEKMEAHQLGLLHRAFSIFIFNSSGELLLQQRALDKYHSGGKWTNTCCSHPRPGEETIHAAHRRLMEEMGMSCALNYGFSFLYKADFSNALTEHEYDHVFFGASDELPIPNPSEVASFRYLNLEDLAREIKINPEDYTPWLKICFSKVLDFKS